MLTFNERQRAYVLTTNDVESAKAAGLTLSKLTRGANGERVFFTADGQDKDKPVDNPYAALPFFKQADAKAKTRLDNLYNDYEASWSKSGNLIVPCPPEVKFKQFQIAGVEYIIRKNGGLIGDEMGIGKTAQAIGIANYTEARRVLVICPAAIRLNWQREIRKWSTIKRVSTYPILRASDGVSPYANYVIISYDLSRHEVLHEVLCGMDWDMVIFDEGHMLKTIDAKRTQAAFGGGRFKNNFITKKSKMTVALTGTPLLNRPRECYTLARALNWESIDYQSYDSFCYRYNPSMQVGVVNIEKEGRLPELRARLRSNFMVRRLKKDVLSELPDKLYEMTYVEPNGAIKNVLAKERLLDFDPNELIRHGFMIDGQISTVRREMGEAKVPRVVEHVKYLLDVLEVPKLVMFSHHRTVMSMLTDALHGYGLVNVQGGVSATQKDQRVNQFITDPLLRIFHGQLDAAGFGIDGLQNVASYVVFAEPAWTPGTNEQAVDRLHRIGQHSNVIAQFLVAEGSLDDQILSKMVGKARTINAAIDGR